MLTKAFCLAKAAECEAAAARKRDAGLRYEWLHTAGEWRLTALLVTEDPTLRTAAPEGGGSA